VCVGNCGYGDRVTRALASRPPLSALLGLLAALALLIGLAAPAWASDQDEINHAIDALSSSKTLYVADSGQINQSSVAASLNPNRKIAVLNVADADSAALKISDALSIDLVAVVSREYIGVGYLNDAFCGNYPVVASKQAVSEHQGDWDSRNLTPVLSAFASKIAAAPAPGSGACDTFLSQGSAGRDASSGGGSGGWIFLVVLAGVIAALVLGFVIYGRKAKAKAMAMAQAKVMPYYTRLAQEILGFDTKDNDDALKAIADASVKYSLAGDQVEKATSVDEWAAARVTVLEGLNASRLARLAVGGEEGDPIPAIAPPAPDQLAAPQQVQVQGESFQGFPQYTPGSSYYYGGGSGVPGGWYSTPFWERLLIGGLFNGMGNGGSGSGRRGGWSSGGWSSGGGRSSGGRGGSSSGGRSSGGGGRSSGGRSSGGRG
jgi:hypothetical protein